MTTRMCLPKTETTLRWLLLLRAFRRRRQRETEKERASSSSCSSRKGPKTAALWVWAQRALDCVHLAIGLCFGIGHLVSGVLDQKKVKIFLDLWAKRKRQALRLGPVNLPIPGVRHGRGARQLHSGALAGQIARVAGPQEAFASSAQLHFLLLLCAPCKRSHFAWPGDCRWNGVFRHRLGARGHVHEPRAHQWLCLPFRR